MKKKSDVARAFAAIVSAVLFSVIFAVLISSCTEQNAPGEVPVKKDAKLQLVVAGASLSTQSRATDSGLPSKNDESKINTLAVGVFKADGSVNSIGEFSLTTNDDVINMDCVPGVCDIIVVANAPEKAFENVQNKADFFAKTVDLSKTASADVQISTNLPMSGQVQATLVAGETPNEVQVNLTRLVARISLAGITTAFTGEDIKNATFELDKVFLCNVLSSSLITPPASDGTNNTFPATPQWLNSDDAVGGEGAWTGEKFLLNEITGVTLTSNDSYSVPNWFYAFANEDEQHRTKLVIAGYFDKDGAGSLEKVYVYYPIVINKAQEGTSFTGTGADEAHDGTISRNIDYRLRAKIAKEGVSSPEEEITVAELQLTVAVDDWKLEIIQDVTIE